MVFCNFCKTVSNSYKQVENISKLLNSVLTCLKLFQTDCIYLQPVLNYNHFNLQGETKEGKEQGASDFTAKSFALAWAVKNLKKTSRHIPVTLNDMNSFDDVLTKLKSAYGVSDSTCFRMKTMSSPDIVTFNRKPLRVFMSSISK